MRAISLLLILALAVVASAQSVKSTKKIKIKPGIHRLDSLLKEVSKATGATFSFDTKKINAAKSVNWTLEQGTLKDVLSTLEKIADVEAIHLDNHIVLVSRTKPKTSETPAIQKPVTKKEEQPNSLPVTPTSLAPASRNQAIANEPLKVELPVVQPKDEIDTIENITQDVPDSTVKTFSDSASLRKQQLHSEKPAAEKVQKVNTDSTQKQINPNPQHKTTPPAPPKKNKSKKSIPLFIRAGLSFNEVMYSNALVQVGLPLLYGSISAGTNFKLTELRYGAGSTINLNDNWKVNAQFDYGKTSKTFNPDSLEIQTDTSSSIAVQSIKVTGKLFRINVLFERALSKNLTVQIGPTFNVLKTEYAVNNKTSEIGDLGSNADKKYRTISAPYLLSNTYDAKSSSNIKMWVGIQVGLSYTIKNWNKK